MLSDTHKPLVVGLTGGIGSGKSTVSRMFAELGTQVIDADIISRQLLEPGATAFDEVMARYGNRIRAQDGRIDRGRLRAIVFSEPAEKAWLEQTLHPRIRDEIQHRIVTSTSSWLLLSVPLLLESPAYDFVDSIVVVDVPEALQLSRTKARDGVSEAQVRTIIAAQMPRKRRLSLADHVIHNDGDLQSLQQQVSLLYDRFERCTREPHQTS